MSTRSHILYFQHSEMFHETSSPQYAFDKFLGWDIEAIIGFPDMSEFTFNDGMLNIDVIPTSELGKEVGDKIIVYGSDLSGVTVDKEGISFTIKGGSFSAKIIETKAYIPKMYKPQLTK